MPLQLVDHEDGLLAVGNSDVDMHPADQQPTCRPLHRFDQLVVAIVGGDVLFAGDREGMGTCTDERETPRRGEPSDLVDGGDQVGVELAGVVAHVGDDLDDALEQLVLGLRMFPAGKRRADLGEEFVGGRDELAARFIDEIELDLDAHRWALIPRELDRHHPPDSL